MKNENSKLEKSGTCLNWLGNRVLETWDCWDSGIRLILNNGEKVMLSQEQYSGWLSGQIYKLGAKS